VKGVNFSSGVRDAGRSVAPLPATSGRALMNGRAGYAASPRPRPTSRKTIRARRRGSVHPAHRLAAAFERLKTGRSVVRAGADKVTGEYRGGGTAPELIFRTIARVWRASRGPGRLTQSVPAIIGMSWYAGGRESASRHAIEWARSGSRSRSR